MLKNNIFILSLLIACTCLSAKTSSKKWVYSYSENCPSCTNTLGVLSNCTLSVEMNFSAQNHFFTASKFTINYSGEVRCVEKESSKVSVKKWSTVSLCKQTAPGSYSSKCQLTSQIPPSISKIVCHKSQYKTPYDAWPEGDTTHNLIFNEKSGAFVIDWIIQDDHVCEFTVTGNATPSQ